MPAASISARRPAPKSVRRAPSSAAKPGSRCCTNALE
ncbi:Uncharacterised protein [Bordetella pertussis]|nr:Uncharacterised protein [Bordetella pertussis]